MCLRDLCAKFFSAIARWHHTARCPWRSVSCDDFSNCFGRL